MYYILLHDIYCIAGLFWVHTPGHEAGSETLGSVSVFSFFSSVSLRHQDPAEHQDQYPDRSVQPTRIDPLSSLNTIDRSISSVSLFSSSQNVNTDVRAVISRTLIHCETDRSAQINVCLQNRTNLLLSLSTNNRS